MPRRLTTIVAADVAGFSRLVGADEEGTLADLRAHRTELIEPLLEKFSGRIANTAGDSLLIEFPSAVEAVRCVVALQEAMATRTRDTPADRRIAHRIGINVGDVMTEGDDLLGDGVNVAARLEALAPPGGIVISRSVRDHVRDRLDLELQDLGDVQVKNISRPVRAFRVLKAAGVSTRAPTPRRPRLPTLAAATLVACAVIFGSIYWQSQRAREAQREPATAALPMPDKPSIVVLPFANRSGDRDQDHVAEGFSTAIRTHLSKFPQLFVIAGSTANTLRDRSVRAREVGSELGVRYVLEGSLQGGSDVFAINAELIEADSEHTLWADQYDFPADDPFAAQTKLIQEIASTLRVVIEEEELAAVRRHPTSSPKAYDLFLRAIAAKQMLSTEGRKKAVRLLNRAIELDPDFLDAHLELSGRYLSLWRFGAAENPDEALRLARHHAARALELEQSDYRGHYRLGNLHLFADHDHELAYAAFQRALKDNPNDADVLHDMGFLRSLMGEGAEAIEWNNKAKRLNPRYPGWYDFNAAMAHFLIRDYDAARLLAKTGMAAYPKALPPRRVLIATLVEMGRIEEAQEEVAEYLSINPDFRLSTFRNTPFQYSADQERYYGALRKAGLPD